MADKGMITLGRLSNIFMGTPEVKRALMREAKRLTEAHFKGRYSAHAARTLLQKELTKWLHDNGFTGHSVNKLVGKAIGHALKGYDHRLRQVLQKAASEAKKRGFDYQSKQLAAGIVGERVGSYVRHFI